MNRPTVPPARNATCMAASIEPVLAAAAVRTLARVASHMPRKPMKPLKQARRRGRRACGTVPDWTWLEALVRCRPFSTSVEVTKTIDGERHDDHDDRAELALDVGHRAFLHRGGDLAHLLGAGVLGQHAPHHDPADDQRDHARPPTAKISQNHSWRPSVKIW